MSTERKSKSPYQRYAKTPYRYSDLYYRWRAAVLRGDEKEARNLGRQHSQRFSVFLEADA